MTWATQRLRITAVVALTLALAQAPARSAQPTGGMFEPGMLPAACSAFRNCATLDIIPSGTGTGSGTITDDQGQINCTIVPGTNAQGTCSGAYDWAPAMAYITVNLTLTPASGSYGCVSGLFCGQESQAWTHGVALYPNDSKHVGIEFDVKLHQLIVRTDGTGSGTVTSAQFTCAAYPCDAGLFPWGTDLAFEATAAPGSMFLGWTGACATQPAICSLSLMADSDTTAVFGTVVNSTPRPSKAPPAPKPTAASPGSTVPPSGGTSASPPAGPASEPSATDGSPEPTSAAGLSTQTAGSAGAPSTVLVAVIAILAGLVGALAAALIVSRRRSA